MKSHFDAAVREQLKGKFDTLDSQVANEIEDMPLQVPEHSIASGGITKSNKKSISKRTMSELENTVVADPAVEASSKHSMLIHESRSKD